MTFDIPWPGLDLVAVQDVAGAIESFGSAYLDRVYTAAEQSESGGRPEALACRFAAKEAVMKVLDPGDRPLAWTDIEVTRRRDSRFEVRLRGSAEGLAREGGITGWAVAMSHAAGTAAALATARRGHISSRSSAGGQQR